MTAVFWYSLFGSVLFTVMVPRYKEIVQTYLAGYVDALPWLLEESDCGLQACLWVFCNYLLRIESLT